MVVEVFLGSWNRKIMLARVESRSRTEKIKNGVGVGVKLKKIPESQTRINFTTTRQPWSTHQSR